MKITWKRRRDLSYDSYHAFLKVMKQKVEVGFITQFDPEAADYGSKWITSTSGRRKEFYDTVKEAKKALIRELKAKKYITVKIKL